MPMYLSRFSYTPETWARMIANPDDRKKAAASYIDSVGGTLHGFWYAFEQQDGIVVWEAPDNVSVAAAALTSGSGGAFRSLETTVLITPEEMTEALHKAQGVTYRPLQTPMTSISVTFCRDSSAQPRVQLPGAPRPVDVDHVPARDTNDVDQSGRLGRRQFCRL